MDVYAYIRGIRCDECDAMRHGRVTKELEY